MKHKIGEEQLELANRIIKLNKNVTACFQVLSVNAQKKSDYNNALAYEKEILNLNRLTNEAYENYFDFLKIVFMYYNSQKDEKGIKNTLDEFINLEEKIKEINDSSNKSYVPEILITEEMKNIFKIAKELRNK